jgi:hypothetical protein
LPYYEVIRLYFLAHPSVHHTICAIVVGITFQPHTKLLLSLIFKYWL